MLQHSGVREAASRGFVFRAAGHVLALLLVAGGTAVALPAANERAVPLDCGTSTELNRNLLQRLQTSPPPVATAAGDHDLHHIAVLENREDLVVWSAGRRQTDTGAIAARFYASHFDEFDYLNIFVASTFANDVFPEAGFAFENNIRNDVRGIGLRQFNNGPAIAPGVFELKSILNMNDLGEYGEDPSEPLPRSRGVVSGIDVLGQEAHHMVAAFIRTIEADILGRGNAHWSFFLQTYGSVMEGNGWRDNRNGSFVTDDSFSGYSQLDLYLWGFLDPLQLDDPIYVIQGPFPNLLDTGGDASTPTPGVRVSGTRQDLSIDILVLSNGVREPDAATSPKTFRMAWILVVPEGTAPDPHDLEKIDDFRVQWEAFFTVETLGIGTMDTELGPDSVTAGFEIPVFAGEPGLTVRFDNDSFGSIRGYLWDFGDGTTSTERHPLHTYTAPGDYTVGLRVDGVGGPARAEKTACVRVGALTTWWEDDFETDRGWERDSTDTAATGAWERAVPRGTFNVTPVGNSTQAMALQPDRDHTAGGTQCLVTGNGTPGGDLSEADVDDGVTTIVSPIVDLAAAEDPVLGFWFWFTNNGGAAPGRDPFTVDVSSDGGATWVRARTYRSSHHSWRQEQVRLRDFVMPTDRVRVRIQARDLLQPSLVEAAVDDVRFFEVGREPTPVVLEALQARATPAGNLLEWTLRDDPADPLVAVAVQRGAAAAGPFATLWRGSPRGSGPVLGGGAWLDTTAPAGDSHWYRLVLESRRGAQPTQAVAVDGGVAGGVRARIESVRRTPEGALDIAFAIAADHTPVRLEVYDVSGRRVRTLERGPRPRGVHVHHWDGRDARGQRVARGIYFLRLTAAGAADHRKLVLSR